MREFLKSTWNIIRKNITSFILFEVIYRIGTTLIFMGLFRRLIAYSLEKNNFSYLTAENFVEFMTSSYTLVGTVILLILGILFLLIEVAAILVCCYFSYNGKILFLTDMFVLGVRKGSRILRKRRWKEFIIFLLALPFLSFHLLVRIGTNVKLINYGIQVIYKKVPHKVLFLLMLLLVFFISWGMTLLLPYAFSGRKKIKFKEVTNKKIIIQGILGQIVLNVLLFLLGMVIYGILLFFAGVFIWITKDGPFVMGALLSFSESVKLFAGMIGGVLGFVGNITYSYVLYLKVIKGSSYEKLSQGEKKKDRKQYLVMAGERKITLLLLIGIVILEGVYIFYVFQNKNEVSSQLLNSMKVTAHRGGAVLAPENSLAALEKAIDIGADYAEIDVQETKDGELIVLHDNNLKRTTGYYKNVWDATLEEVKEQTMVGRLTNKYPEEKIPTLEEVLKLCDNRLDLNIEIKYNGHNDDIVPKVLALLEEMKFEKKCMITSMNYKFLKEVKEINPQMKTGYIMTMTYGSISNIEAADFFSVKWTYVNRRFIEEAHALGKEVHAWTINSKGNMERMKALSVDNIITDDPISAREVSVAGSIKVSLPYILKYIFK